MLKNITRLFLIFILMWNFSMLSIAQNIPSFKVRVFDTSSTGFYFMTPIKVGVGAAQFNPTQFILDKNGEVIYFKEFFVGLNAGDFKILGNGQLCYANINKYFLMDSMFNIVDSVACKNGIAQDGHDLQILPNGNYLLLGSENITMDLSSYRLFKNGKFGSTKAVVKCGVIQEQDKNKNVVFEWHSKDHFLFEDVDTNRLVSPTNVDWTHFNAIELDKDGNILLSSRHFNEITKINRTTGNIIWRLGGNANQFKFTNDSGMFKAQHDIRRLPNGNITLLDNGDIGPPFHATAAKEYQLDEVKMETSLVWNFVNDAEKYSLGIGNVQRLSNGNTLVNYGMVTELKKMFDVVNKNGQLVFTLEFPDSLRSYRVFNYDKLPWNLKRPNVYCKSIGGKYFLETEAGYSSYKWSTGETTQQIEITKSGNYSVFVPKGLGGFISSEIINVTNVLNPCNNVGVLNPTHSNKTIKIYPNPVMDKITFTGADKNDLYEIYNASGEIVWQGLFIDQHDFSSLPKGFYFLKIISENVVQSVKFVKQ